MGKGAIKRLLIAASTWVLLANVVASGAELITAGESESGLPRTKIRGSEGQLSTAHLSLAKLPRSFFSILATSG